MTQWSPEDVDRVLDQIKDLIRRDWIKKLNVVSEIGVKSTTKPGDQWASYAPNGTMSITIQINGGQRDGEIEERKTPAGSDAVGTGGAVT